MVKQKRKHNAKTDVMKSLPSDEQIVTESKAYNLYDMEYDDDDDRKIRLAFQAGAKWMKKKIERQIERGNVA